MVLDGGRVRARVLWEGGVLWVGHLMVEIAFIHAPMYLGRGLHGQQRDEGQTRFDWIVGLAY